MTHGEALQHLGLGAAPGSAAEVERGFRQRVQRLNGLLAFPPPGRRREEIVQELAQAGQARSVLLGGLAGSTAPAQTVSVPGPRPSPATSPGRVQSRGSSGAARSGASPAGGPPGRTHPPAPPAPAQAAPASGPRPPAGPSPGPGRLAPASSSAPAPAPAPHPPPAASPAPPPARGPSAPPPPARRRSPGGAWACAALLLAAFALGYAYQARREGRRPELVVIPYAPRGPGIARSLPPALDPESEPALLQVHTWPPAEVSLDGEPIGESPSPVWHKLRPGRHGLGLHTRTHGSRTLWLDLESGVRHVLKLNFEDAPAPEP